MPKDYMNIKIKLDIEFVTKFNELKKKYGKTLCELNGFSNNQLSYTDFIDNFVDSTTVADASIDGNANAGTKDICSLESEMSKPHAKLLAFNKIYYEINKKYGKESADTWLEQEWVGNFYLHDASSSSFKPYCFAYDIERLVKEGLYFIDNFNNQPPKHLTTYTDFVGEFVSWASNRSSGAVGLPSFLVYSFYFWKKDIKENFIIKSPEYYRDQEFQRITYKLNQPYLRVNQSAFTNFSIFDREYLIALFGGKEFPDGTDIVDYIDEIIEYQKSFMDVVSKVRSANMMTFPVLSFALLRKNGKFADEEFAKWCCNHNMQWADSNFFISEDVTSLSNCCFDKDQKCLTKTSNGVKLLSFIDLYNTKPSGKNFTIFHNGSWVKGKLIRVKNDKPMYKIITANHKEMTVTSDHIFPTLLGDKKTEDMTTDDYILFNTRRLDTFPEKDKKLTYEQGYLIGMYLGDGSCSTSAYNTSTVHLSLNKNKYITAKNKVVKAISDIGSDAIFNLGKEYNNVFPTTIRCNKVYNFIKEYVTGNYCNEKELDMSVLLQSYRFRKGILDGYYLTDGGNSNRIYTTSKNLVCQIECMITSMGLNSVINREDRTDEKVIIRGDEYSRNFPLYRIRWYNPENKRSRNDVFIVRNNCEYFKVSSIEKTNITEDYVYCFEIDNRNEPYFTLPNGVITHNCRLISDVKDLGYFNSIGGSALEVGSIKVNTINLANISYMSKTEDEYMHILRNRVDTCLKTLDCIRSIIARNVEKGLLPNYSLEVINMKNQYNTIGIIGIYEVLQKFGYVSKDEFGNTTYTDDGVALAKNILKTITECKNDFGKDKDYSINIEEVPAERAAVILTQKDKQFYPDEAYELPLYGNQWIPLGVKTTLQEKIRLSAILDKACSGGSIAHINIEAPFNNFETAWDMLNYVADKGVVYFAFCLKISACKNNHGFYGDVCPTCGNKKETTYQRVVGFLTPEKTYSKERKEEFNMRQWLTVGDLQ